MDYNISNNDSLTGRFSYYKGDDDAIDRIGTNNIVGPSQGTFLHSRDTQQWSPGITTSRPAVINQLRTQIAPGTSAKTLSNDPDGTEISISGFGTFWTVLHDTIQYI